MNHSTRIKIAAGVTALALAVLTVAGLATRDDGAGAQTAAVSSPPQTVQVGEPLAAAANMLEQVTDQALPAEADGTYDDEDPYDGDEYEGDDGDEYEGYEDD